MDAKSKAGISSVTSRKKKNRVSEINCVPWKKEYPKKIIRVVYIILIQLAFAFKTVSNCFAYSGD